MWMIPFFDAASQAKLSADKNPSPFCHIFFCVSLAESAKLMWNSITTCNCGKKRLLEGQLAQTTPNTTPSPPPASPKKMLTMIVVFKIRPTSTFGITFGVY